MRVTIRRREVLDIIARRNISQNNLARRAGIESGHMSQLLMGKRNPAGKTREKLLRALGDLSFDEVFEVEHEDLSGGVAVSEAQEPGP